MASPENTLTIRNLACALNSDHEGNPWMASGQDGRFLRLNRNDRVLGAVGNGMGIGKCQSIKASYWAFDKHDSLYAGDSSVGRITEMTAPRKWSTMFIEHPESRCDTAGHVASSFSSDKGDPGSLRDHSEEIRYASQQAHVDRRLDK
jgi:hypothetical protein